MCIGSRDKVHKQILYKDKDQSIELHQQGPDYTLITNVCGVDYTEVTLSQEDFDRMVSRMESVCEPMRK